MEALNGNSQNLGDFIAFGRYTIFIIITYEMMLFPQMSNMVFMIFGRSNLSQHFYLESLGGFAPKITSCGNYNFENMTTTEACSAFKQLQNESDECTPQLEAQFGSLAYEVSL